MKCPTYYFYAYTLVADWLNILHLLVS